MPGLRKLAREKADPPFRVWAAITPPRCSPGGVFVSTELRSGAGKHRHGNGQASRRTVKWKIAPPARNERAPPRLGPHAATSQRYSDGLASSLAIHLCLYCALAACFALVMYYLMQPTRLSNPGMAALKPSRTTTNYIELLRSEREAAKADMKIERDLETTGAATRETSDIKPETKKAKPQTSTRSQNHVAPRTQPAEMPHYAQQPSFDSYKPLY